MGKKLFIAEKPSVAQEFAKALGVNAGRRDGYLESEDCVVTWCVGHLVTMSYPEAYDPALKRWSMDTLPFIPKQWKYEVIPSVKKQFSVVKSLLNRPDVETIYICTDSGREGEYIYRLVDQMAGVRGKERRRVWIDSQTEEEIRRGIAQAKDWSAYDNLSSSAYLRAKEDYLMGINFSRALTLRYGPGVASFMKTKYSVISVGRVMTCVLGMVVRREREIRNFVKTPFYRVIAGIPIGGRNTDAEWRVTPDSAFYQSPKLYKENGFLKREDAQALIDGLKSRPPMEVTVVKKEKKKETKNPPLLFNLAELQNACSKRFRISPDETLKIVQELYEKKLVTYPRTDARVLSSAIAKEIGKNIKGLTSLESVGAFAKEVLEGDAYRSVGKTRYTDDKQITDHYAIIPTGQGLGALKGLSKTAAGIYELICRRFLSIFYPPAIYRKYSLEYQKDTEHFFSSFRMLEQEGYLKVAGKPASSQGKEPSQRSADAYDKSDAAEERGKQPEEGQEAEADEALAEALEKLRKGSRLPLSSLGIREGETSPPKRYNSGSLILAMENAGQLIEDEDLRAQIRGSGIGTSATRAEILKKLVTIGYLKLNRKTQTITPEKLGEAVYEVVDFSMKQLLNPELTASWEKGLTYVAEGSISSEEYMQKLSAFVTRRTESVRQAARPDLLRGRFEAFAPFYK